MLELCSEPIHINPNHTDMCRFCVYVIIYRDSTAIVSTILNWTPTQLPAASSSIQQCRSIQKRLHCLSKSIGPWHHGGFNGEQGIVDSQQEVPQRIHLRCKMLRKRSDDLNIAAHGVFQTSVRAGQVYCVLSLLETSWKAMSWSCLWPPIASHQTWGLEKSRTLSNQWSARGDGIASWFSKLSQNPGCHRKVEVGWHETILWVRDLQALYVAWATASRWIHGGESRTWP